MSFLRRLMIGIKPLNIHQIHSSCSIQARKIEIKECEKEVVIEGVSVQQSNVIKCSDKSNSKCHPLCQLPFVHEIKHTDVLILDQFLGKNGEIIPRNVTGLCRRQHYRMNKLIKMAQKAGLFPPEKDLYREEPLRPGG